MLINEILSNKEQIDLVRLIMNTTLNVLGNVVPEPTTSKNTVVQAVKKNRGTNVKAPKIPSPPAPKPFPKPKLLNSPTKIATTIAPPKPAYKSSGQQISAKTLEKAQAKIPKSLQPLPSSVLSPVNKNPTPADKKALAKKNDLIDFLKSAQTNR